MERNIYRNITVPVTGEAEDSACQTIGGSYGVDAESLGAAVAAFPNGPMRGPVCTPGHHLGDDGGGRCTACNARLAPRDLMLVGLLLMGLSIIAVLVLLALALWWVVG